MNDWNRFGALLAGLRENCGYPSARKFYRAGGGAKRFGCTYRHYKNVEKGRCAPNERVMASVCQMLHFEEDPVGAAGDLLDEYVRQKFPTNLALLLRRTASRDHAASPPPPEMQGVLVRHALENSHALTAEQVLAYCSSQEAYGVFEILSNDKRRWSLPELSKLLRMDTGKTKEAAEKLRSSGVVKRDSSGRYWCPWADKVLMCLHRGDPRLIAAYDGLPRFWDGISQPGARYLISAKLRPSLFSGRVGRLQRSTERRAVWRGDPADVPQGPRHGAGRFGDHGAAVFRFLRKRRPAD